MKALSTPHVLVDPGDEVIASCHAVDKYIRTNRDESRLARGVMVNGEWFRGFTGYDNDQSEIQNQRDHDTAQLRHTCVLQDDVDIDKWRKSVPGWDKIMEYCERAVNITNHRAQLVAYTDTHFDNHILVRSHILFQDGTEVFLTCTRPMQAKGLLNTCGVAHFDWHIDDDDENGHMDAKWTTVR